MNILNGFVQHKIYENSNNKRNESPPSNEKVKSLVLYIAFGKYIIII